MIFAVDAVLLAM